MDQATLKTIAESAGKVFPFVERIGLEALEVEADRCVLRVPLEPNVNHIGTMYAGALFTLAEIPGGVLALTSFDMSSFYPIVKDMFIRFRRPGATACTVEVSLPVEEAARIQAQAAEHGKAEYSLETEIKDEAGTVVATTVANYQLRKIGI